MQSRFVHVVGPASHLPDSIIVDTNVMVARYLATHQHHGARDAARIEAFVEQLTADNRRVVLTPSGYTELLHTSIRFRYQRELRHNQQQITARFGTRITSWTELYKRDAAILEHHSTELHQLREALALQGIAISGPEDLGPLTAGTLWHDELVRYITRYRLDTTDSLILMEANRLGISAIITMDRDMERALPDFDVYLWR
jgi:predicted nucleic acid-binding protein